jgi:hypothetical protein
MSFYKQSGYTQITGTSVDGNVRGDDQMLELLCGVSGMRNKQLTPFRGFSLAVSNSRPRPACLRESEPVPPTCRSLRFSVDSNCFAFCAGKECTLLRI